MLMTSNYSLKLFLLVIHYKQEQRYCIEINPQIKLVFIAERSYATSYFEKGHITTSNNIFSHFIQIYVLKLLLYKSFIE